MKLTILSIKTDGLEWCHLLKEKNPIKDQNINIYMYIDIINFSISNNELNSSGFSIKAEEGNLLIFPSYLYHSVGKNLSSEDRIIVSFNIDIITYKNASY